ncbi:hypothetical protein [Lapidilactobacillus bayanensis]|uniref:hypothetical protein n=1 Tax=Lapidilactobacillus bayanensis TaxID=2485998 RepID=UPI000F799FFC|nr:hypothetical protein [Lapidilactobacillus bayanensis]
MVENTVPKAVKVSNASNILEITFDNGEKRYLRSHYMKNYLDAWSPSKGKGKRLNLILRPTAMWQGANPRIMDDGTVIIASNDRYSPDELWNDSVDSVSKLNSKEK